LTLSDFKSALASTRLSLDGRATYGALLILVDGLHPDDAAEGADCSRQAIEAAIAKIERATMRCSHCGARVKR
jgi:hypothetical protein